MPTDIGSPRAVTRGPWSPAGCRDTLLPVVTRWWLVVTADHQESLLSGLPDTDAATPRTTIRTTMLARLSAAATVAYALVLVAATHHPRPVDLIGPGLAGPDGPGDKTLHFWAYAVLAGLAATTLALAHRWNSSSMSRLMLALAVFALVDEATQPLPWFGRTADPLDWLYDAFGVAAGIAAVAFARLGLTRRA
jgi:VanZ family protein